MKALSVQQPWAWLMIHGPKDIENRGWRTEVRGRIAIHAGKKVDREGYDWVRLNFPDLAMPHLESMPRGGVVGTAVLGDCVNKAPGNPWFFGPWGFTLHKPSPCAFVPCRGELGFFEVSAVDGVPVPGPNV